MVTENNPLNSQPPKYFGLMFHAHLKIKAIYIIVFHFSQIIKRPEELI